MRRVFDNSAPRSGPMTQGKPDDTAEFTTCDHSGS